jgi:hypothetical protein
MARVIVEDESLRDGLQFEPKVLRLEDKVVDAYEALLGRPLPGRMNRVLKAQGDCHLTSTHASAGKDQDR